MTREKIDKYYEKQGIKVRFNTLGYNETLTKSYIHTFKNIVDNSEFKKSNIVKLQCYNSIYQLKPRDKLTGFEKLRDRDIEFRDKAASVVTESQFTPTLTIDEETLTDVAGSYKEELIKSLLDLDDILLYLSGGIDSEFVARVLLEIKKPFTPVIFQWTNNAGNIINEHDLKHAFTFCVDNDLSPIVQTINIERLWETDEFLQLAKEIQITSPQLLTYTHIINVINSQYPNKTHLFGGEVRFYNRILDKKKCNIVFLQKVCPPDYNGGSYQGQTTGSGSCTLQYFNTSGLWRVARTGFGSVDGTWTTTPESSYEFLIDSVTDNGSLGVGQIIPNAPTTWAPIDNFPTQICRVQIGNGSSLRDASFEIWVRSITEPGNICVSTIRLVIEGTL